MVERFSVDDWYHVRECADRIAVQLRAKGIRFEGFVGLPPVRYEHYREFKTATGMQLPNDFLELTRGFSGGWSFPWRLKIGDEWLRPAVAPSSIGTHEPFIGLHGDNTLLVMYNQFQDLMQDCAVYDEPPDAAKRFVLPLSAAADGDYLALRFDRDPPLVVWLDHETGYDVARARTICHGFREYVLRWATLGFPDKEDVVRWVDDAKGMLVHDDQRAKDWLEWLADPDRK